MGYEDPGPQPLTYGELGPVRPLYVADGNPFDAGSECTLDGMPVSCTNAARLVGNGGAVTAPLESVAAVTNGREYVGFAYFNPAASSAHERAFLSPMRTGRCCWT